jgi:UDP-glucuronate 4-epimerase
MSILVTGAAGFLGSHVADHLLAEGQTVLGLDSFHDFYSRELKEANLKNAKSYDRFSLVEGDICDRDTLESLRDDIQLVVHLAARAGVRPSLDNPVEYSTVNIGGTWNLLDWASSRGIKRLIFASSSSVYGNSPKVPFCERDFVGEPISPYAATKRSGELACHTYVHLHRMRILALRFFTVYGPRQRPDLAIHKFAKLLSQGSPLPMFGDGETARDYTYIEDIVQGIDGAFHLLGTSEEPLFEIVNLGESKTVKLREMIQILSDEIGVQPLIEKLPPQPGDVTRTFADISKAQKLLKYNPRWDFREGIKGFLEWFPSLPKE